MPREDGFSGKELLDTINKRSEQRKVFEDIHIKGEHIQELCRDKPLCSQFNNCLTKQKSNLADKLRIIGTVPQNLTSIRSCPEWSLNDEVKSAHRPCREIHRDATVVRLHELESAVLFVRLNLEGNVDRSFDIVDLNRTRELQIVGKAQFAIRHTTSDDIRKQIADLLLLQCVGAGFPHVTDFNAVLDRLDVLQEEQCRVSNVHQLFSDCLLDLLHGFKAIVALLVDMVAKLEEGRERLGDRDRVRIRQVDIVRHPD